MSTGDAACQPVALYLSSFAYVLVHALRRLALRGTDRAWAQVGTIRLRLLKIAAEVRRSARRMCNSLAKCLPLENAVRSRLRGFALLTAHCRGHLLTAVPGDACPKKSLHCARIFLVPPVYAAKPAEPSATSGRYSLP
jgi:hypothetical protein